MKPSAVRNKVEAFFKRYAATYARALADKPGVEAAVSDAFADYFVESSPTGVYGGKNGLMFRLMAKRGFVRYRKIGVQSMDVARLDAAEGWPARDGAGDMGFANATPDGRSARPHRVRAHVLPRADARQATDLRLHRDRRGSHPQAASSCLRMDRKRPGRHFVARPAVCERRLASHGRE